MYSNTRNNRENDRQALDLPSSQPRTLSTSTNNLQDLSISEDKLPNYRQGRRNAIAPIDLHINARTLFDVPEGSTQDCKAVTFTKDTLTYIKKKHGIDNDVNVVVSSVRIDSDDDPNIDELFNHIISDEGWDQRAQCKMILINHAPISDHIGYAFVFNDKDGKRSVLLSKDEESGWSINRSLT